MRLLSMLYVSPQLCTLLLRMDGIREIIHGSIHASRMTAWIANMKIPFKPYLKHNRYWVQLWRPCTLNANMCLFRITWQTNIWKANDGRKKNPKETEGSFGNGTRGALVTSAQTHVKVTVKCSLSHLTCYWSNDLTTPT